MSNGADCDEAPVAAPGNEPIVLAPRVEVCGWDARMTDEWRYITAPPHVRRFIAGTFAEAVDELARLGYVFSVKPEAVEVSIVEWYAAQAGEPFCACGRRVSECDGSRRACGK